MSSVNGEDKAYNPAPLLFQSLDVQRMPGIDPPGFALESFKKGINVIHGPNAAGKTMLARSMNALLWPQEIGGSDALVRGRCVVDGEEWYVQLEGKNRTFERGGSSDPGPALPPPEQRDRYNLALHELLQNSTTDRTFAERIVQELFGGYDVSAAAEQLGFDASHSYPGNTKQRAVEALESLREAREEMNALEREEEKLVELRQEKKQAAEARDRLDLLRQVLEVFDARDDVRKVRSTIDEFPDVMEKVTGRERERVEQLNQKISSLQDQKEQAEEELAEAEENKNALEYPYDHAVTDELRNWEGRYETLKDLENTIIQLKDERSAAREKRDEEQKELGEDVDPDQLADLRRPDYDELRSFASEAEQVHNRLESLETLRSLLDVDEEREEVPDLDRLRRGCEVLENWLANPSRRDSSDGLSVESKWIRYGSQAVIFLITIIGGLFFHVGFLIFLIFPLIVFAYEQFMEGASSSSSMRDSARQEFQQQDLSTEPADWTVSSVRSCLRDLYEQRAEQFIQQVKRERWEVNRDEYSELLDRAKELIQKREELADEFGVAPDNDERTLYFLLNRLSRWKDAQANVREIEKELEEKQERYQRILTELNEEFERWGLPEAGEASDVRRNLDEIERRMEEFQKAERTIEQAREKRSEASDRLPELIEQRETIYSELDLEPGDDAALEKLLDRREQFQDLQSTLDQKKGVSESKRSELNEMSGANPDLLERDRSEIRREIEELERKAASYDELTEQIARIEEKLDEARRGYEVEPAMAEKDRAFSALREQLQSDYEQMVGHVLAQHVQSVNTAQTMPAVFEQARSLLSTISTGRYELQVEQSNPPSFRVIDTLVNTGRNLDQLSAGTRIQVLLAVRLAFCQHGEERVRVPLFMDETLANADDERARTIINSVLNLANEGRQVFYFTAQGDEVAKWKAVADERNKSIGEFDLREHTDRDLDGSVRVPDLSEVQTADRTIPSADDHDHESYGEALEVPPLDPRDEAASAHLWYLIEDVDALEHLVSSGIEYWGPLRTLLDHGTDVSENASQRRAIQRGGERAQALEAFIEQWQIGRNRSVHRAELRASGAVTDNFIDEVTELAETCDGDPAEVMAELRDGAVSGFRTNKMDELEEFFIHEGYIDPDDPLEPDLIRAAMVSAVDEDVFDEPEAEVERLWARIQNGLSSN